MDALIVPAIIAKTQDELDRMLERVRGKVERIMLDVMDGAFVPNTSLDFDFNLPADFEYEAHLMVMKPLDWVKENAEKVDIAILHIETLDDIVGAIGFVESKGLKTTLALKPETTLETVLPHLHEVHGILVLTVDPGRYGGKFLHAVLGKIRQLREISAKVSIEVDGGMNPTNARLARDSGANIIASGSYILKSSDVDRAIKELEDAVSG